MKEKLDIEIDTKNLIIKINGDYKPSVVYSYLKGLWYHNNEYIKFPFPLSSEIDAFGLLYFEVHEGWEIILPNNKTL